jgi:hypothetical protein
MFNSRTEIEIEDSAGAWVVTMPGLVPAIAVLGVLGIVALPLRRRWKATQPTARQILDRRLAEGAITRRQYDDLRAAIES